MFEEFGRILSVALEGASRTGIIALHQHLRQDEILRLLLMLVYRNLLEIDSSSVYWTTINGVKFLKIKFNMEQVPQPQKSLV